MELWLLSIGLLGALYLWRADFQQYSVFTVGVFRRVHRYRATTDSECTDTYCDHDVVDGEARKATKEVVVFGCPLFRHNTVVNHYCPDHTSFEYRQGEFAVTRTEQVKQTVIAGISAFAEWEVQRQQNKRPFDDVQTGTGTAVSLLPVAFLIVIAASIIAVFRRV